MRRINYEKTNEKYNEYINNNPIVGQQIIDDGKEQIYSKYNDYDFISMEDRAILYFGKENIVWEDVPDDEE